MTDTRVTARPDAAPAVGRRGFSVGGALIALGLLALVAVIVFVVMSRRSDQALRTQAVASAASSLAAETPRPAR
jgi:type II secretory pathway component PulJ